MENAPFFDDISIGLTGGAAHWVTTSDSLRIRVGHWPLAAAKGTVIVFPGRTEFIEKYTGAAQAFQERGYASVAIDWRGQGLADRMTANRDIGHVGRFADYQNDVSAAMQQVAALNLPRPWFLVAHSMGGCIGLRSLLDGLAVNAVMFSAPMWGIQMAGAVRPFAWGLSEISRYLRFDHRLSPGQSTESFLLRDSFETNPLTNDVTMFEAMRTQLRKRPELGLGGPSLRWLNMALHEMHQLHHRPAPNMPCLTYLGGRETIIDPDRIRQRMAGWPGGDLRFIPEGRHEMMMDSPSLRAAVFDATVAHFDAHR
ncbi:alpha/beta hydrolase [Yoonia sp.]|uniref:alpha/beta hydrolase n=1 Tax=Yoonia sp. TaxID=2212373 RepID=UPI0019E38344|nr:alpha/beta hydrolase [Yoonia sp.]MBE0412646.1 alpha/beta hydrolase [Yoonia sp.]